MTEFETKIIDTLKFGPVTVTLMEKRDAALFDMQQPYIVFFENGYGNDDTVFKSSDFQRADSFFKGFCAGLLKVVKNRDGRSYPIKK